VIAELAVVLVASEEPETRRDLSAIEKLTRQGDHTVNKVGLEDVLADLPLAGLVRGHRAVRQHEAGDAVRG
jgi:hypothetical protein